MNKYETLIIGSTLLLLLIGIYAVYSASGPIGYLQYDGDVGYFFRRQLIALGIGLVSFIFLWRINYNFVINLSPILFLINIVMLLALFFYGIGKHGVNRWLPIGDVFFIQPSILALFTVPLFITFVKKNNKKRNSNTGKMEWFILFMLSVLFLLIVFQPDLSMAFIITAVSLIVMFVGGFSIKRLIVIGFLIIFLTFIFIISANYRIDRIISFLNPWENQKDIGYQAVQAMISLGSGGMFGRGICHGIQKFFYLPAPHTDFIYPVIGEELGLWGTTLLLLCYITLIGASVKASLNSGSEIAGMLGVGISSVIAVPAIINLGMATGLLPISGIPLPFISYSGTGLITSLSSTGILASIARRKGRDAEVEDEFIIYGEYEETDL
ncbi:MAG: FtsW/RodA/SpoVE family cell cycle protein [bacterium]